VTEKELMGGPLDGARVEVNGKKERLKIALRVSPVRLVANYVESANPKYYQYQNTTILIGNPKTCDLYAEPVYYEEDGNGRKYTIWTLRD
jgi:hypothetical protein